MQRADRTKTSWKWPTLDYDPLTNWRTISGVELGKKGWSDAVMMCELQIPLCIFGV